MNGHSTDRPKRSDMPESGIGQPASAGMSKLSPISTTDLQNLDRALRHYTGSDNMLINASADLLAVCGVMRRMTTGAELNTIRMELSRAIIDLKYRVVNLDYPPSVAENLCLLFAITLDEFVMLSAWSRERGWENRTLVADLFGFRDGGDRFYNIAERALMQPKALREFLEILYLFLKLGYRGKYTRGTENERDRLIHRIETALSLVPHSADVKPAGRRIRDTKAPKSRISTLNKLFAAVTAIAVMSLGTWAARSQMEHHIYTTFQERRAQAETESAVDFIFSSENGSLVARARP
jgi:type IV/VI secretion system ImpK/VasF family protein